jgi:hypothetical protein
MGNIQKVQRGQWPKAETVNSIIDELVRLGKVTGDSAIGVRSTPSGVQLYLKQPTIVFHGQITDTGPNGDEDDYDDSRYWVTQSYCDNGEADDDTTKVSFAEEPEQTNSINNPKHRIVTATNLAEAKPDSHNLLVGQYVDVLGVYDAGVPSRIRYYFNQGGASLPLFIKITAFATINGATNRWKYSWVQQKLSASGVWVEKNNGMSSGTTGMFAYNSVEANNSAAGIQGNSIDIANVPAGFSIKPVQGNPIVQAYILYNCNVPREKEVTFAYENAVDGKCS